MRKTNENPSFYLVCLLTHFSSIFYLFVSILFRFTFYTQEKYKSAVVRNCNFLILHPVKAHSLKTMRCGYRKLHIIIYKI